MKRIKRSIAQTELAKFTPDSDKFSVEKPLKLMFECRLPNSNIYSLNGGGYVLGD